MKAIIYIKVVLFITLIMTVFHLCILVKLIPYTIVWGGRLKTEDEMYTIEIISGLLNLFLILILLMKGNYLKFQFNKKIVDGTLWIFFLVFILNTIGNILAQTTFEKMFSVLTLILAVSIGNILIRKETANRNVT